MVWWLLIIGRRVVADPQIKRVDGHFLNGQWSLNTANTFPKFGRNAGGPGNRNRLIAFRPGVVAFFLDLVKFAFHVRYLLF